MRSKLFILIIAVIVSGSFAYAQPGHFRNMDDLELTDDQQRQMDDLGYQHQKSMIKKKAALEEAQLDFHKLMRSVEVDEKAVLKQQGKVSSLKGEMAQSKIKHKLAMRKVLNKEQIETMLKSQRGRGEGKGFHQGGKNRHHGNDHDNHMGSWKRTEKSLRRR